MNFEQVLNIPPPIFESCKTVMKGQDLIGFSNTITESKIFFEENEKFLCTETAALAKCLFVLKELDDGQLKYVQILHKEVLEFFLLETSKLFGKMTIGLAKPVRLDLYHTIDLPTRNVIDYILVRLIGLAKQLYKIVHSCKRATDVLEVTTYLGKYSRVASTMRNIICRIFATAARMHEFIYVSYTKFRVYSMKLANCSTSWLPFGFSLPDTLRLTYNLDTLNVQSNAVRASVDPQLSYYELSKDQVVEDEVVIIDPDENSEERVEPQSLPKTMIFRVVYIVNNGNPNLLMVSNGDKGVSDAIRKLEEHCQQEASGQAPSAEKA